MDKQDILNNLDFKAYYASQLPSLKNNGTDMAMSLCPFHDDHRESLSVNLSTGLFKCFGCNIKGSVFDFHMKRYDVDYKTAFNALAKEAGLTTEPQKRIVKTYDYVNETGDLLFQAVRYEPKDFKQRRPDGKDKWVWNLEGVRLVPYNLPEVIKAKSLIIVEGEKDVETLRDIGLIATTNPMGAGKWNPEYNQYFKDRKVCILPDNDPPDPKRNNIRIGYEHAAQVATNLKGIAESVKLVELPGIPEKGDITDWITQGHIKEELIELIKTTPEWIPEEPVTLISEKVKTVKVVSISEFLSLKLPPRENMLNPWLPTQGLAMVYGLRGIGKTYFVMGVAVAVSSANKFLKWDAGKAYGVLYIDGEMPAVVVQERFSNIILGSENKPIAKLNIVTPDLQKWGMPDLSTIQGQEAFSPFLDDISLVIVDNISTLCRTGRENEGESWLPVQEWGLRLRSKHISVLFVHHAGKGGFQRGTSKREDVLDTIISLKRPPDYMPDEGARFEVHFEKARNIHGEDVKPFEAKLITVDGIHQWIIKDLEDSLTERVAKLLNEGIPQREIHELLGVSKGTVSKHKNKAQAQGLLEVRL